MTIDYADLSERITRYKQGAYDWQKRRHNDWDTNYMLYRDRVLTNRITQRQSVNIPLMKMIVKTILSNIDDPPALFFKSKSNNEEQQIYFNEHWKTCGKQNNLPLKDVIDKKNVALYGRSFKKLNILNGRFYYGIHDGYDIMVDRFTDPSDIDTASYLVHQGIWKSLKNLQYNVNYDQSEVLKVVRFYNSDEGMRRSGENVEQMTAKNQRMAIMGAEPDFTQVGETWVELNENFIKLWDEEAKEYVNCFAITCDQALAEDNTGTLAILMAKPLEEVIGNTSDHYWKKHWPIDWWADDIEGTDIWNDSIADIGRTPNLVVNTYFSQMVENRTLRNFGMNYYNSMIEGFIPQTFEPEAFGWYPIPGNPNEMIKRVDIPDLTDSANDMNFIIGLVERATAATAQQQGTSSPEKITLGEVQILQRNVQTRIQSMAKFYNLSWEKFGEKYVKMIEAAKDKLDPIELSSVGYKGTVFTKTVEHGDLVDEKGYVVEVQQLREKEADDTARLQGLNAAVGNMPGNLPLKKLYYQALLDLGKLTPEEKKQVMDFQEQADKAPTVLPPPGGAIKPSTGSPMPMNPAPATPEQATVLPRFTARPAVS